MFLCYKPRWGTALAIIALCLIAASSSTVGQTTATHVSGELVVLHDVPVLRVWGDDYDRGYAHGYLLADDAIAFLSTTLLSPKMLPDIEVYEQKILPMVQQRFDIQEPRLAELKGMLRGITDARGEKGIRLERLNRDLTLADLIAGNSLADWVRLGCSSFSAWGSATPDGKTITARNLDYFDLTGLRTQHVLIVHINPGPGVRSWVSIGWPGFTGACTAINEDGVTLSMHDSNGRKPTHRGQFVPRTYALRDAIEQAHAASAIEDVERVLQREASLTGNNFHVSGPYRGKIDPATVFEYDGDVMQGKGVTRRVAADEKSEPLAEVLLCTNHYCRRAAPKACARYARIKAYLEKLRSEDRKIDITIARDVMRSVAGPSEVQPSDTVHSVVFLPNDKEFYVSFADAEQHNATQNEPIRFTLAELFKK